MYEAVVGVHFRLQAVELHLMEQPFHLLQLILAHPLIDGYHLPRAAGAVGARAASASAVGGVEDVVFDRLSSNNRNIYISCELGEKRINFKKYTERGIFFYESISNSRRYSKTCVTLMARKKYRSKRI